MINRSKNFNTGNILAGGDVKIGDNFYRSIEYKEINQKIEDLEALVEGAADTKKKHAYLERLLKEKKLLEEFKSEIRSLAKTFSDIPLNTERLKIAKEHFDLGEYKAARAVMNAGEVIIEFEQLLTKKEALEKDFEATKTALINKSNEFLILAELATLDYTNENRFIESEEFCQKSIKAYRNEKNVSAYAHLLYSQNKFELAKNLYEELIELFKELTLKDRAYYLVYLINSYLTLSRIISLTGSLADARAILDLALLECENDPFEKNHILFAFKSMIYQNIANGYILEKKYQEAAISYDKALAIEQDLQIHDKEHSPILTIILLNKVADFLIKIRQLDKVEAYLNEALRIFDDFLLDNKITIDKYLPGLADLHTSFGIFHALKLNFSASQTSFEEAIKMYRKMLRFNRYGYLPPLAGLLLKYVKYIPKDQVHRQKAACEEAIEILKSLHESNEYNYNLSIAYIRLAKIELTNSGNIETVNSLLKKVVDLRRSLSKKGDDFYMKFFLDTLEEVGLIKFQLNDFKAAENYYLEALEVCNKFSVKEYATHEFYIGMLHNNLGNLYFSTKRFNEADVFISKALAIFEELTKKEKFSDRNENPKIFSARILSNKATIKIAKDDLLNALKLYDRSAKMYRELVEVNPECFYDLAEILTLSASTLEKMNENDAALEEIEEALDIYDTLKENDPEASDAYDNLIKIKERLTVAGIQ